MDRRARMHRALDVVLGGKHTGVRDGFFNPTTSGSYTHLRDVLSGFNVALRRHKKEPDDPIWLKDADSCLKAYVKYYADVPEYDLHLFPTPASMQTKLKAARSTK